MRAVFLCWLWATASLAAGLPLAPSVFQMHVRPQLMGIDQDIQQIFLAMPGYPPEALRAMELVDQLQKHTLAAGALCPRALNAACLPQMQSTLLVLRELERLCLTQRKHGQPSSEVALGALLGERQWLQLLSSTQELKSGLEASILAVAAGRKPELMTMWHWRQLSDESDNWLNLLLIEYVPARLQEDFRSAWMNFFQPLRHQALLMNNSLFLTTNLYSLNFYWNLLNVKLTKRLKKTPEGMQGPLNAIQNRWNQVMRVCFGK